MMKDYLHSTYLRYLVAVSNEKEGGNGRRLEQLLIINWLGFCLLGRGIELYFFLSICC
jgi:hypothetical protein